MNPPEEVRPESEQAYSPLGRGKKIHPLPVITTAVPQRTEKLKHQSWIERSGLKRWFQENWRGKLTEEDRAKVRFHHTVLANVFLRDLPLTTRARVVEGLTDITKYYLAWEKRRGGARALYHPVFGDPEIHVERGSNLQLWQTAHEGLHILQHEGYLPSNHPSTYAFTTVVRLETGQMEFVEKAGDDKGHFKKKFLDPNLYFRLVKEGRAHEAFADGWMLHPYGDEAYWDFELYLRKEADFEKEFMAFGELIENRFGIRKPYDLVMDIGTARGERAYAIGLLSGNLDNAWSVLYLHGRGMPFEEAERAVVAAIEAGQENKLVDFRPLVANQVERLAAYEEVFGTRKLWEEKFPEKMRSLVHNLRCAKDFVFEYALALKQSLEKVPKEEIRQRHQLFSTWLKEKGRNGQINLSRIASQTETLLNRSLDIGEESGANVFIFPGKEKALEMSIAGVRLGFTVGPMSATLPRIYSQVFPEQLGTVHIHPFYDAPPSVPDLVNLALNDQEVFQVIRSANALYFVIKPLETALANCELSRSQKMAIRKKEVWGALRQLVRPNVDRKVMTQETAKRLGLEIYKAESPEYASLPRRIGLPSEPIPAYQVSRLN
jgi:hypothetical protein